MKRTIAVLLFLSAALLPAPRAAAQTAAELERVLALPTVSYGDAAWLVLNAAGTAALPEATESSADGAYRFAADNKWLSKKAAAETPVTLGELSFLIMKAFNIKGGFMYSLFPGPRYAYRELTYLKIIRGRVYSTMTVSGAQLLRIIGRALEYAGDPAVLPAGAETTIPMIQEERERVVEVIHTEPEEKRVTDTEVRTTGEGITISQNITLNRVEITLLDEGSGE